tara:strand:+ start:5445 stop:6737 length:1293 start_codon:yes stop_codon:yes gene_type:complete
MLEQYEIIDSDQFLEIRLDFNESLTGEAIYNSHKNFHSIRLRNVRSPHFLGRQNLDHLLAISFYVKQIGRDLKLIFYPRGFLPAKFNWINSGKSLSVRFRNTYPLRTQLDAKSENFLVCIDPGHGGHDPGAQGKNFDEKDLVLAMSKALKREFSERAGFTSFLTRTRDYKIKLEDRPKICDRANSDLFISLHMNSSTPPTRGFEIFYLSDKGAEENMQPKLLESELSGTEIQGKKEISKTKASLVRHIMLEKILINIKQRETLNSSAHLAHAIARHFKTIKGSKSRGVHRQEYVVLKNVKTPSVLFEMGFITNWRDEKFFSDEVTQELAASKIADGIIEFIRRAKLKPRSFEAPSKSIIRELRAPPKPDPSKLMYYKVQAGDTFIKIAQKFKIPYLKLMALNPNVKPARMQVGYKIIVPNIEAGESSKVK